MKLTTTSEDPKFQRSLVHGIILSLLNDSKIRISDFSLSIYSTQFYISVFLTRTNPEGSFKNCIVAMAIWREWISRMWD